MQQPRTVDPHRVIEHLMKTIARQALQIAQLEAFIEQEQEVEA